MNQHEYDSFDDIVNSYLDYVTGNDLFNKIDESRIINLFSLPLLIKQQAILLGRGFSNYDSPISHLNDDLQYIIKRAAFYKMEIAGIEDELFMNEPNESLEKILAQHKEFYNMYRYEYLKMNNKLST
jgi:hypothetical protein